MAIYRGPGGSGDATADASSQASVATIKAAEAANSASAASSSATSAATEATNASTSASNSATSATASASSASAASTSETNAASSATDAAASFDSFDDRYLGAKSSDPSTDNDGNALITGALYFNTTTEVMMTYTGSIWQTITTGSGGLQAANNLSDVSSAATSRTNLGLAIGSDVQAHSAVLDATTASYTTAEETKLSGIETGATADQTAGEIKTAYESNADTNAFTDADHTKLDGIAASADVTGTANVTAAGALMDSEVTNLAQVKAFDTADYATAAQGTLAASAIQTGDSPSFAGLTVDTNTLYVDSANNNVGIGTSSPGYTLDVVTASGDAAMRLITEGTGSGDHTFLRNAIGGTTGSNYIYFGDGDDADAGLIQYNHASNYMRFYTNASEAMRINSSGNVGIGTSSPAATVDVSGNARGAVVTDNDLSFDLSAGNNFSCTPTGGGTLTFTNHLAGQSGFIWLDNSGGHAIAAAGTTKINAADLTAISTAGVYTLSYFDNGTNAYVSVSRSFA